MWIVSDEVMHKLLGGEFCQVVELKRLEPDLNIKELYGFQFKYFTYDGFRKFYNKHLSSIIKDMHWLYDDSLLIKFIKFILRIK